MTEKEQNPAIKETVSKLMESISPQDQRLFEEWIKIPNTPNVFPEVIKLNMKYGQKKVSEISKRIEEARKELGIDYDALRNEILSHIAN